MVGLIIKGSTAMFLEGADPGSPNAAVIVDRLRTRKHWPLALRLDELCLKPVARPRPLARSSLNWAYVFVSLSENDDRRLEPGPFDDDLAGVVKAIEAEQGPGARSIAAGH